MRELATLECLSLRVSSKNALWTPTVVPLLASPPKLPRRCCWQIDDVLLEEILLQLDGEICSILRRIADGSFVKNETAASIQVLAMETAGAPATVHRARVVRKDRHASHLSLTYLLKSIRLSIYN